MRNFLLLLNHNMILTWYILGQIFALTCIKMKMSFIQWSLDTSKVIIIIINHFFQFFLFIVWCKSLYIDNLWRICLNFERELQNNDKWNKMVTYEVPCATMICHMQWVLLGIIVMYMVGLFDKGWISNTIIHASCIRLWIMF